MPEWLRIARLFKGIRETIGGKLNPKVAEFFKATHFPLAKLTSTTPWCAALVSYALEQAYAPSPRTANAAACAAFGEECEPKLGAIIVLAPGVQGAGISGHVGFYEGTLTPESFWLFSGNCMNTAKSHVYPVSRIVACRWPVIGEGPRAA
ncbi:MAG: hypothetical protein H0X39_00405 [Actinobacteria bacterium]|nr:hypothetical protein [Actinomycetota bacterium]